MDKLAYEIKVSLEVELEEILNSENIVSEQKLNYWSSKIVAYPEAYKKHIIDLLVDNLFLAKSEK